MELTYQKMNLQRRYVDISLLAVKQIPQISRETTDNDAYKHASTHTHTEALQLQIQKQVEHENEYIFNCAKKNSDMPLYPKFQNTDSGYQL